MLSPGIRPRTSYPLSPRPTVELHPQPQGSFVVYLLRFCDVVSFSLSSKWDVFCGGVFPSVTFISQFPGDGLSSVVFRVTSLCLHRGRWPPMCLYSLVTRPTVWPVPSVFRERPSYCLRIFSPVTFHCQKEEAVFHENLICLGPNTALSSLDEFLEESSKAQSDSQEPIITVQPLESSLTQKSSNALLKEVTSKKGE